MTILLIVFIVVAVVSVPVTKFAVESDYNMDETPWYLKIVLYPLSYALWGYLLFPLWAAAVWARSFHSKSPPFDLNLEIKGIVLGFCWLLVFCQLFYRLGFRVAKRAT